MKNKGFSLVEVMIAITIIGFLSSGGWIIVKKNISRAQDAKRKADLDKLANYLEDYYNNQGCYPTAPEICCDSASTTDNPCHFCGKANYGSIGFPLPCDPKYPKNDCEDYLYYAEDASCPQWYHAYAQLDKPNAGSAGEKRFVCLSEDCGAEPFCCYNYGVSSSNVNLVKCGDKSGCGTGPHCAPEPTNTPIATNTPIPTSTLAPTPTNTLAPTPTNTLAPTNTPTTCLADGETCSADGDCCSGHCYDDTDGDGYTATDSPKICHADNYIGTGDCCDTDADSYPGATSYHTTTNNCGSWDWDCNGTIRKDYESCEFLTSCSCRGDWDGCGGVYYRGYAASEDLTTCGTTFDVYQCCCTHITNDCVKYDMCHSLGSSGAQMCVSCYTNPYGTSTCRCK